MRQFVTHPSDLDPCCLIVRLITLRTEDAALLARVVRDVDAAHARRRIQGAQGQLPRKQTAQGQSLPREMRTRTRVRVHAGSFFCSNERSRWRRHRDEGGYRDEARRMKPTARDGRRLTTATRLATDRPFLRLASVMPSSVPHLARSSLVSNLCATMHYRQ